MLGLVLFIIIHLSVQAADYHPHQLIIKLQSALSKATIPHWPVYSHRQSSLFTDYAQNRYYVLEFDDSLDVDHVYRDFIRQGYDVYYNHILHACADITPPNDPRYTNQRHLTRIQAPLAWEYFLGNGSVPVFILDSGIDYLHPDLIPSLYHNPNEIAFNGLDDDQNGLIDDTIGYDFVTVDPGQTDNGDGYPPDNDVMDCAAHGTGVAGVAGAATNNGIGIAAINWKARIYSIRIAYSYQGSLDALESDVISGIEYALQMKAKVINFSYGGYAKTPALHAAIQKAVQNGALFVTSAGNEFTETKYFPSAYPEAIAVTGLYSNDMNASYVYGSWVDLAAPSEMLTTKPGGDRYETTSGTSISAPLISAALAYLWEYRPQYSAAQIRNLLYQTADNIDDLNPALRHKMGYGRLNIGRAVQLADSSCLIELDSVELSSLNHDQPILPGQNVTLSFKLINSGTVLPSTQLKLTFPLHSAYMVASVDQFSLPILTSGQSWQSPAINLTLSSALPFESELFFQLEFSSDSQTLGHLNQVLQPKVNPLFYTLQAGDLQCSFSSIGLMGHNDIDFSHKYHPYSEYYLGEGLLYKNFPDICFTSSFWFGGSNTSVYDGTIKNTIKQLSDWVVYAPFTIDTLPSGLISLQTIFSSDTSNQHIRVSQTIYYQPDSSFFLLHYTILNNTLQHVESPRYGMFWELDMIDYNQNQVMLDTSCGLLIQKYLGDLFTGIACLQGSSTRYKSIKDYFGLSLGDTQKYRYLDTTNLHQDTGDMAILISNGSPNNRLEVYTQQPDSLESWYFLSVAESLDLVYQRLESAKSMYKLLQTGIPSQESLPALVPIVDFYPNPAGRQITIRYQLLHPGPYQLQVSNLLGQLLWNTSLDLTQPSGKIPLLIPSFPNGLYLIKLQQKSQTYVKKMLILK